MSLILNYIDENIKLKDTYQKNKNELNKIIKFIEKNGYDVDSDFYIDLINSSDKLKQILKIIVDNNNDNIKSNTVNFDNNIFMLNFIICKFF